VPKPEPEKPVSPKPVKQEKKGLFSKLKDLF
jgi:hypothetical protein